jgi:NitT/TauT family transport system ATP-binding protein
MFITSDNISFRYVPTKSVLNGVSFALGESHTLSIVGASGCGKSTLLRIISGILPNAEGHQLDGRIRICGRTPDEYRRSGKLAFMFQEATLMPNLSVKENIILPLKIKSLPDEGRVDDLLQMVGLSAFADYLPKHLSGGMKTRVALARSFITGPELLLLDEPFSALDIAWKSKLYIELEKLREKYRTTVIFVTHDVQEALLLSNDVMVFDSRGGIQAKFTISANRAIRDRVSDITGFMDEVYHDYMLPIQEAIIKEKNQRGTSNTLETETTARRAEKGSDDDEKVDAVHAV